MLRETSTEGDSKDSLFLVALARKELDKVGGVMVVSSPLEKEFSGGDA